MGSRDVLRKLLNQEIKLDPPSGSERILERYFDDRRPSPCEPQKRLPGRPKVEAGKKARNFTLCLAPRYLDFLDRMMVRDPKVRGRGRKIRFIIDRFIEHEKRSVQHIRLIRRTLAEVQRTLTTFSGRVRKGEKLQLSPKEREEISTSVGPVLGLLNVLSYSPKTLQKMLPTEDWALLSFCLNWNSNRSVIL